MIGDKNGAGGRLIPQVSGGSWLIARPHLRPGANNGTAASPWTAQDPPPLSVQPPSSSSQQQDSLSNLENPTSSQQ